MPRCVISILVVAAAVSTAFDPAQAATCEVHRRPLVFASDADVDMFVKSGKDCRVKFSEPERFKVESNEIVARPHYGGVRVDTVSSVYYRSNPGYRGQDRFSFMLCGMEAGKRGCSTVRVKVSVR